MNRRDFIKAAGGALVTFGLGSIAQDRQKAGDIGGKILPEQHTCTIVDAVKEVPQVTRPHAVKFEGDGRTTYFEFPPLPVCSALLKVWVDGTEMPLETVRWTSGKFGFVLSQPPLPGAIVAAVLTVMG